MTWGMRIDTTIITFNTFAVLFCFYYLQYLKFSPMQINKNISYYSLYIRSLKYVFNKEFKWFRTIHVHICKYTADFSFTNERSYSEM